MLAILTNCNVPYIISGIKKICISGWSGLILLFKWEKLYAHTDKGYCMWFIGQGQ